MSKPIIALFPSVSSDEKKMTVQTRYIHAVELAGGYPMPLPASENIETLTKLINLSDGYIFTGGVDIDPKLYGEETLPECGEITPLRDRIELLSAPLIFESKKPVLGICRGIQSMNVALGGTLFQDIPSQWKTDLVHQQEAPYDIPIHNVDIYKNTLLYDIIGKTRIAVNSMHHQAVKVLGKNAIICATATDGIHEAIEVPSLPFCLGVQWHPECLVNNDENALNIFKAFIDAARKA